MKKHVLTLTCMLIIILAVAQTNSDNEKLETFTDSRDNKTYEIVKIGEQTWMAENLAYLPKVNPPNEGSENKPYYYVYGYEGKDKKEAKATNNYKTYGVLYNWTAAIKACPNDWHLPSDTEWDALAAYISSDKNIGTKNNIGDWTKIGKFLKSKTGWYNDGIGTDDYGFKAVAGGYHCDDGTFFTIGYGGGWWSSTERFTTDACYRYMSHNNYRVNKSVVNKEVGRSVRCVRD